MVTNAEIKELLVTREPVIATVRGVAVGGYDIEFAYVSAIIIRYDPKEKKHNIFAELMDYSFHAVEITPLKNIRKKENNSSSGKE